MNLENFGLRVYANALRRGKIRPLPTDRHLESVSSIRDEVNELAAASEEKPSEHLPQYTETAEELADIVIAGITELYRRDIRIEEILNAKATFNENR